MNNDLEKTLSKIVPNVKSFLYVNYGLTVTEKDVLKTLSLYYSKKTDQILEDIGDIAVSPHIPEHHEFINLLPKGSIFTGGREFDNEKLKAIVLFFATVLGIGRLSKTRLNKLAFYSDFTHFKKAGKSISGSTYKRLPHGPVISGFEETLAELEGKGNIFLQEGSGKSDGSFINSSDGSWRTILTDEEKETCREVYRKFGKMRAGEISEVSHKEIAWQNTKTGDLISYGFANHLKD